MGWVSCIQASTCALHALPPALYADLVGKPFARDGRGPEAYDCLGLVMAVLRRNGVALPAYASTPEELARQHTEGMLGPCYRLERADTGAVVLLRGLRPDERHLGLMLDRWHMLHASEDAGQVVKENLQRSIWGRRVLGYYFPENPR